MTTKVTVDPAGHRIEVKLTEGQLDDGTTTTERLEPGSPAREFWLYGSRVLTLREVPAETSPPA
ncbi:MAG: hypothetical protein WDN25_13530 [Acetobacteraceae bacterium]